MHSSAKAECVAVSYFFTGSSALLLLCKFRTGIAESDVSVMVPAQVVGLSDVNVRPLFGN